MLHWKVDHVMLWVLCGSDFSPVMAKHQTLDFLFGQTRFSACGKEWQSCLHSFVRVPPRGDYVATVTEDDLRNPSASALEMFMALANAILYSRFQVLFGVPGMFSVI